MLHGYWQLYYSNQNFRFYKDIANDVEQWFDTSSHAEDDKIPLPIGKNKKLIGLFKDKLGGKIIKEFVGFRAKTYEYLMDDDSENEIGKETIKCTIERILKFNDYKDCQSNDKIKLKS